VEGTVLQARKSFRLTVESRVKVLPINHPCAAAWAAVQKEHLPTNCPHAAWAKTHRQRTRKAGAKFRSGKLNTNKWETISI
jgi:hypothetical protein